MQITRNLSIEPLVRITDPQFEHQYKLGVWWAIYGDEQGTGRYDDTYLMENIENNLRRCFELSHVGFYLGMIHGGYLVAEKKAATTSETLSVTG